MDGQLTSIRTRRRPAFVCRHSEAGIARPGKAHVTGLISEAQVGILKQPENADRFPFPKLLAALATGRRIRQLFGMREGWPLPRIHADALRADKDAVFLF